MSQNPLQVLLSQPRTYHGPSFSGAHNFQIHSASFVDVTVTNEDRLDALYKLCTPTAIFDSAERGPASKCLEGTSQTSLNRIREWSNSDSGPPVLWLSGPVGTGKSCISQTMAEEWTKQGRTIATFFFSSQVQGIFVKKSRWVRWTGKILSFARKNSGGSEDKKDKIPLILTLAYQLARNIPGVDKHILATIRRDPSILDAVMSKQFYELVLRPLQDVAPSSRPVIIAIDALDECRSTQYQSDLLKLVAACASTERGVKFFLSSRPERHISVPMRKISHLSYVVSLERTPETDSDIEKYLKEEFSSIHENTPTFQFDDTTITELVNRSSGQFIFASTIAKYVGEVKENPRLQLEHIVGSAPVNPSTKPYQNLDALYLNILRNSGTHPDILVQLLGLVLATGGELTLHQLDNLCVPKLQDGDSMVKLRPLHSLLRMPDTALETDNVNIQILHASFEEFLTTPSRSHKYHVDVAKIHSRIISSWISKAIFHLYLALSEERGAIALNDDETPTPEVISKERSFQSMSPLFFIAYIAQELNPLVYLRITLQFCAQAFLFIFRWRRFWPFVFSRYFIVMMILLLPVVIGNFISFNIYQFILRKVLSFVGIEFLPDWVVVMSPLGFMCTPAALAFVIFMIFPGIEFCRIFANAMAVIYVSVVLSAPTLLLFSFYSGVTLFLPFELLKFLVASFGLTLWLKPLLEDPVNQVLDKIVEYIRTEALPGIRRWMEGRSEPADIENTRLGV